MNVPNSRKRLRQLCALTWVALAITSNQAWAASAKYSRQLDTLGPLFTSWCIEVHGVIAVSDVHTVICDQADHGGRAALFEAFRGNSGPRHVRTRFLIIPDGPGIVLVQATRSYAYFNPAGNLVESTISDAKAERDLHDLLKDYGGVD